MAAQRILFVEASTGGVKFTALGTPAFNRGIALLPATLVARRDDARLESQGALMCAWHGGKLLEVRWFADDVERENQFFGPPDPASSGPSAVEQAFDAFYRHIAKLDATLQTLEAVEAFSRQASELRVELRAARRARFDDGWDLAYGRSLAPFASRRRSSAIIPGPPWRGSKART